MHLVLCLSLLSPCGNALASAGCEHFGTPWSTDARLFLHNHLDNSLDPRAIDMKAARVHCISVTSVTLFDWQAKHVTSVTLFDWQAKQVTSPSHPTVTMSQFTLLTPLNLLIMSIVK
ncbi:hypothetical protein BC628DRAFT_1342505 [Trametes gibbosa]|nr:hypothetical protein BC628DRAFT_1342505 [Trametes gibbosa]